MTACNARAWYVYSVLPAAEGAPPGEGVLPGTTVEAIHFDQLTVLASQVPRALFDSKDAANLTADPAWIAARIEAHHAVNMAAAAAGSCLPLAFGALFSSLDLLHDWLIPRATTLGTALAQVDGQTEWALSIREDAAAHAEWLDREDPVLKRLAKAVAAAGEGTAFLMSRRLEKARIAARHAHVGAVAATVPARLAGAGFCVLDEVTQAPLPGWTLLVSNRRSPGPGQPNNSLEQKLAEQVQMLAAECETTGLSLCLSGPWPAYSFARAALAQEIAYA